MIYDHSLMILVKYELWVNFVCVWEVNPSRAARTAACGVCLSRVVWMKSISFIRLWFVDVLLTPPHWFGSRYGSITGSSQSAKRLSKTLDKKLVLEMVLKSSSLFTILWVCFWILGKLFMDSPWTWRSSSSRRRTSTVFIWIKGTSPVLCIFWGVTGCLVTPLPVQEVGWNSSSQSGVKNCICKII